LLVDLFGLRVELVATGVHFQTLGRGRHRLAMVCKEGHALFMELALLLVNLLLLEILDLGVDIGDGVCLLRGLGHHVGLDGRLRYGSRVTLHHGIGSRYHIRVVRIGHDGVGGGVALLGDEGLRRAVLEAMKVELHAVANVGYAAHIEELVELVIGSGSHGLFVAVPGGGTHHDEVWVCQSGTGIQ
jgi:hypothetical protein